MGFQKHHHPSRVCLNWEENEDSQWTFFHCCLGFYFARTAPGQGRAQEGRPAWKEAGPFRGLEASCSIPPAPGSQASAAWDTFRVHIPAARLPRLSVPVSPPQNPAGSSDTQLWPPAYPVVCAGLDRTWARGRQESAQFGASHMAGHRAPMSSR